MKGKQTLGSYSPIRLSLRKLSIYNHTVGHKRIAPMATDCD